MKIINLYCNIYIYAIQFKKKEKMKIVYTEKERGSLKNIHINKKQIWLLNYTQHSLFFQIIFTATIEIY